MVKRAIIAVKTENDIICCKRKIKFPKKISGSKKKGLMNPSRYQPPEGPQVPEFCNTLNDAKKNNNKIRFLARWERKRKRKRNMKSCHNNV